MTETTEVRVPDIGDFTDVPVIEIHVGAGDPVAPEDPLVTLESDKATMDVPSPFAGVVKQLSVKIGDRVSEGSVLLTLEQDAAGRSAPAPGAAAEATAPAEAAPTEAAAPAEAAPTAPAAAEPGHPTPDAPESGASAGAAGRTTHDAQVVVIGSGPGGYTAAFRAADLGLRTVLIERFDTLGGVCLNVGCIPSKALLHAARVLAEAEEMGSRGIQFGRPKIDLDVLRSWKESVVAKLTGGLGALAKQRKVEVIQGVARFDGPNAIAVGERTVTFDSCIIATGSRAVALPGLPEDPRIVDSTGALELGHLPRRLLVIGGGIIGLELATVFDALGSRVTVVELLEQLLPGCDPDLVKPLHDHIGARYEAILLKTSVDSIEAQRSGLKVSLSSGASERFDQVLVAVGRVPNAEALDPSKASVALDDHGFIPVDGQMRTNVPHIYAIGDVVGGPMLAHKASHEGKVAAEVIAGHDVEFDPRTIPSVAYTDPEVAWMGLTETAARAQGVEYERAVIPWSVSGRALTLGRGEGHTKLLFERGSRRLLGAGIVGVSAGEMIAEVVHALEMGSDAQDIALTVHPHPTLTETVMLSAELAEGSITDLLAPAGARR